MRSHSLFIVLATICSMGVARAEMPELSAASASSDAPPTSTAGNRSKTPRGTIGVHRIEAARPLGGGELVLTVAGEYSSTTDLFNQGASATNERQVQRLTIAWAPVDALELSLSQKSLTNYNNSYQPGTIQVLGDPSLGIKFSRGLSEMIGAGALIDIMVPTSPRGTGLKSEAYRLTLLAAATVTPVSFFEASINAGYVIDNTDKLFVRQELDPMLRFTAGVAKQNQLVAGVGLATDFPVTSYLGFGPFAEVHAAIPMGGDADAAENAIVATGGAKIYPASRALMEVSIGGDYRISGEPVYAKMNMPGLPPWEIFGRVTAHLNVVSDEPASGGPRSCSADADCSASQECVDRMCVLVKEVTKEVIKEVTTAAPTFIVEGAIFDEESGEPIRNAVVTISGSDASALAVDPKSGKFKSYGIPTGEGLVQLKAEAPGYRPSESTMPKGASGESKLVTFKLQSLGKDAMGELKGSLKDARSGKPIKGEIFIPVLSKKFHADGEGKFSASMKAGRYQVLISSRGYTTQKKEIEIRPGDVVILNVDLSKR